MISDLELNLIGGFFPRPYQRLLSVIQKRINYPQEEIYTTLKLLASQGILDIIWIGGTAVFSLNVEREEAADGYKFYIKLKRGEFEKLYGNLAKKVESYISSVPDEIVLVYGKHTKGTAEPYDPVVLVSISSGDDVNQPGTETKNYRMLRLMAETDENEDSDDRPDSSKQSKTEKNEMSGQETKGQNLSEITLIKMSKSEIRNFKKIDPDTFRDIVNFSFPLRGIKLYYDFLYKEIGVGGN